MFYQIKETLTKTTLEECLEKKYPYVIIMNTELWNKHKESFQMGIDLDFDENIHSTKAEVNFDSLTGTFYIPDRNNLEEAFSFSFALDEKGIVFIDDGNNVINIIGEIIKTKKTKLPSLERFIYDFLETIIDKDFNLLENIDSSLIKIEDELLKNNSKDLSSNFNDTRSTLLTLKSHYEQLLYLSQEFEENENEFFSDDNLRYFHLFSSRVTRLQSKINYLREYIMQIKDLQKSQLDQKQNKIVSTLTIVTSIFLPLTLIVGWYGMNFVYMPELKSPYAYPIIIIISLLIPTVLITFFKHKKWI